MTNEEINAIEARANAATPGEWGAHKMEWSDFYFPSWVPSEVQGQIKSFWSIDSGRGPSHWLKNAQLNKSPCLGDRVRIHSILPKKLVIGRFIFAWNNIGRVVDDEGCVGLLKWSRDENRKVLDCHEANGGKHHARYLFSVRCSRLAVAISRRLEV